MLCKCYIIITFFLEITRFRGYKNRNICLARPSNRANFATESSKLYNLLNCVEFWLDTKLITIEFAIIDTHRVDNMEIMLAQVTPHHTLKIRKIF